MKLLATTVLALAYAQGPGDDERKNKYGNNNNNNNSGGQAYGDPHFMVATAGQDAVCFDFNPVGGTEMNLLIDPESSLSISATAENRENGKTFMNSVHFASPEGAHLEFDIEGVHLAGLGDEKPTAKHPLTGHQQYGDLLFIEKWSEDGFHEHTKIQIEDGPTFIIKGNLLKESLGVAVVDTTGIGQKSRGIIGQFIRDDAYVITPKDEPSEDGEEQATVSAGGMSINALKEHFHHQESCWVVDQSDVLYLMANL